MEVLIGGQQQPVKITRKRMKNINLRIGKQGEILISCPAYATQAEIKRLIYLNEAWILERQLQRNKEAEVNREGTGGSSVFWLGEEKKVRYEIASRDAVSLDGDEIVFFLKERTSERIEKAFRKAANQKLLNLAEEARFQWDVLICEANHIPLPEIKTRYMTSRWGVCYPMKHAITLSTRLIHYPEECFEYVLLHEYAHFLVPNHSAAFYAIISQYMPDYKQRRKRLK